MSLPKLRHRFTHFAKPPAPEKKPPEKPSEVIKDVGEKFNEASGLALIGKTMDSLNLATAAATNVLANLLPAFPAATMGSIAFGAPHAHTAHPPSGPLPIPPTPFPPIGPVTLGCSVQVLINGMPAARAGDIGMSPTCCGLIGMYEVKTGSSKVFIGGARAARMTDFTHHCTPVAQGTAGRAAKATAAASKAARLASAAGKLMATASMGMMVASTTSQAIGIAGDVVAATETSNEQMSAALALNAGLMSAQLANDAAAMAAAAAMGKDQPMVPPTGTLGSILANTSPNVLIGGLPLPPYMAMAKGFMKLAKGLKRRPKSKRPLKKGPGPEL